MSLREQPLRVKVGETQRRVENSSRIQVLGSRLLLNAQTHMVPAVFNRQADYSQLASSRCTFSFVNRHFKLRNCECVCETC
jgi:hypothetical protein